MSLEALSASLQKLDGELQKVGASLSGMTEGMPVLFGLVEKASAGLDTLEGQLDKLINDTAPRSFAIIAEMTRKLADGEISMAQFEQEYAKLQALNAQGGGFLGDLDKLLLQIRNHMLGLTEAVGGSAAPVTGDGPIGEQSSGFSGGAGGSGGFGQSAGGGPLGTQGFSGGTRRLVATAIDLGSGRPTASNAAQRARILHQLAQNTRNTRR